MQPTSEIKALIEKKIGKNISDFSIFAKTDFSTIWSMGNKQFLLKRPLHVENISEGKFTEKIYRYSKELLPKSIYLKNGYFLVERLYTVPFDVNSVKEVIKRYAYFQRYSKNFKVKIQKFYPNTFAKMLRTLLNSEEITSSINEKNNLSKTKKLIACIEKYNIPMSVEHGDLHYGNILYNSKSNKLKIIDWSEISFTHPFLSIAHFIFAIEKINKEYQRDILDTYLSIWGNDQDKMLELYSKVSRIAPLFYAFRYFKSSKFFQGKAKKKVINDVNFLLKTYSERIET